jgi:hypothetical protein
MVGLPEKNKYPIEPPSALRLNLFLQCQNEGKNYTLIYTCNTKNIIMKNKLKKTVVFSYILLLALAMSLITQAGYGQVKDSTPVKISYPNIPKFSISSYTIYQKSFHVGYERVLNRNHSIYIFGGYNEFPKIVNLNLTGSAITGSKNKSGYTMGAEFRFYLPKENKDPAPHGVFLAPYISYYNFSSTNTLTHTDSTGSQSASLMLNTNLFNVGVELGYQFVIARRFIVDCELLGPSFSYYSFKATLDGHINGDPNETLQAVLEALKDKFPLLKDLSSSKTVFSSGSATQKFPLFGFRYVISIGYAF